MDISRILVGSGSTPNARFVGAAPGVQAVFARTYAPRCIFDYPEPDGFRRYFGRFVRDTYTEEPPVIRLAPFAMSVDDAPVACIFARFDAAESTLLLDYVVVTTDEPEFPSYQSDSILFCRKILRPFGIERVRTTCRGRDEKWYDFLIERGFRHDDYYPGYYENGDDRVDLVFAGEE